MDVLVNGDGFGMISLILTIWVLTAWFFFREPYDLMRKYQMTAMSKTHPAIMSRFVILANNLKLKKLPVLVRIPDAKTPLIFSFGTFRHQYIAISDNQLISLVKNKSLDAVLLHEIGHVAAGDVWKTGLSIQFTKWLFILESTKLIQAIVGNPLKELFTITDIFITLGGVLTSIIVLWATRILIQMREFAADEYVLSHVVDTELINALNYSAIDRTYPQDHPNSFYGKGVTGLFTRMFSFHPDTSERKKAVKDKENLIALVPRMSFIFGLVIGQVTSYFSNVSAGKILIGWMLLFGPFFLAPAIASAYNNIRAGRFWPLVNNVTLFCLGCAMSFTVHTFPNSFYELSGVTGKSIFIKSTYGFSQEVSYFFDLFFVTLLGMPLILSGLVGCFIYLSEKLYPGAHFLMPWLLQFPINLWMFWYWISWMNGWSFNPVGISIFLLFGAIWYFYFLVIKNGIGNKRHDKEIVSV